MYNLPSVLFVSCSILCSTVQKIQIRLSYVNIIQILNLEQIIYCNQVPPESRQGLLLEKRLGPHGLEKQADSNYMRYKKK